MRYDSLKVFKQSKYKNIFHSDGFEALITITDCQWILEVIANDIHKTFAKKPYFQTVGISVREDHSCNIYSRINEEVLFSKEYAHTVFPVGIIELYITPLNTNDMLIFLMSEYMI